METFFGRQDGTGRPVLIKRLTSPVANLERLLETLRLMQGPGLPAVLEAGSTAEGVCLVIEGAEGESLRWVMSTLAKAAGFIAPAEGLSVVAQVATVLEALHQKNATHGDVCPATIFLTEPGDVQIHDGAIAAALGGQGELGPWRSEVNSIAPEQLVAVATPPSDVFRLGLVLYELAVGRPLWSGPSPGHLCQVAGAWRGLNREKVLQVPEPWLTLLETMLAVDPRARPTIRQVIAVLEDARRESGWSATAADESARLFARASEGRQPVFATDAGLGTEIHLRLFTPSGASTSAITSPGAVVARIATKKVSREELTPSRIEAMPEIPSDEPLEVRVLNLLVERGKITRHEATTAQEAAEALGGTAASFLLDSGAIDEDGVVAATAELTRTPSISVRKLSEAIPTPEALQLISLNLSETTQSVPLGLKGGSQLMVAMADPMDAKALGLLKGAIGGKSLIAFRAGTRALSKARDRIYSAARETTEPRYDPMLLLVPIPDVAPQPSKIAVAADLPSRIMDTLLRLQGPRGDQALRLVRLATGLAGRLGASGAEVATAGLATRAIVATTLASNLALHEVPKLSDLRERFGSDATAESFLMALEGFPARMPDAPMLKAVVIAFAFCAHTRFASSGPSAQSAALGSFGIRYQLPQSMLELLAAELSSN